MSPDGTFAFRYDRTTAQSFRTRSLTTVAAQHRMPERLPPPPGPWGNGLPASFIHAQRYLCLEGQPTREAYDLTTGVSVTDADVVSTQCDGTFAVDLIAHYADQAARYERDVELLESTVCRVDGFLFPKTLCRPR